MLSGAPLPLGRDCCKICGDSIGCGMNFGCLSCESCKAFFRRCCSKSATKLLCPFAGKCQITKASRKACPACRLQKCIREGMRGEIVDAWKKHWADGKKNEEKGKRKEMSGARPKKCICKCRCGAGGLMRGVVERGTQTEGGMEGALDSLERAMLEELGRASLILDSPLPMAQHFAPLNLTLIDAFRASELGMRRMVEMCKQIGAFRALDPRDQSALLRNSLLGLLILRGAMAFDSSNEAWRHPILDGAGRRPLPFCLNLNVLPANEQHSAEFRRFLMTFEEKWRTNRPTMLILHSIALFTAPRNEGQLLVEKERIGELRRKYCELLKRHLEVEGRGAEIGQTFGHLMGKLEELAELSESVHRFYCGVNPGELGESLLRELLAAK